MSTEKSLTTTEFPPEVHQSLERLKTVAKSVKSRKEWDEHPEARKGTPEEIALSESRRKPHQCRAHSVRTGLACEGTGIRVGLCRVHGAEEPHLKKKHQQKIVEMLPKAEKALNELLDQTDHLPSRLNAVKEVHDRALGPVRGGEQGKSAVQVNIGIFGHPQIAESTPAIDVEVIDSEDEA